MITALRGLKPKLMEINTVQELAAAYDADKLFGQWVKAKGRSIWMAKQSWHTATTFTELNYGAQLLLVAEVLFLWQKSTGMCINAWCPEARILLDEFLNPKP